MGIYSRHILPVLIDRGMRNKAMTEHRPHIPSLATGRVLEVGIGSGLNIPHYTDAIDHLFGLEPSSKLIELAGREAVQVSFPVDFIESGAEDIPLDKQSIDTVVSTWTLCSIPDIEAALAEIRRVLKPDGRFLFIEHGLAPDPPVVRWQKRLAPVFRTLAGCNPDRPMDELIGAAGFSLERMQREYLDGPKFLAYHYQGEARP